ncbi:hypothetical protein AB0D38_24515, partial [Streptomyces sp. NPDC048279]|uniref:hypothetical protein n=1 Tax=Streptomyces sp. NPDC048279 TaxID=3154714 RepID=UPI00341C99C4
RAVPPADAGHLAAGAADRGTPAPKDAGGGVVQNINQHGTGRIVVGGTIDTINFSDGGDR